VVQDEKRMSFTEHLGELRTRIIWSCIALGISVFFCYAISDFLIKLLAWPLLEGGQWTVLNPMEPIVVKFRIAGYGGVVFALPFIIWQICAFVFPGLYANERRVVQILITGCSILAIIGVGVAYFGVFPLVLPYLLQWVPDWVQVNLRLNETLSIIAFLLLGFSVAFQFPMAVLVLVYIGLLTPQTLKKYRKLAIIGMSIISAVLTPPDPFSMLIMLAPLVCLYESSIWLSYLVILRKRRTPSE